MTVFLRYLQTSVQHAYEEGDLEGLGTGYCIPNICPAGCCPGDPDKYVKAGGTLFVLTLLNPFMPNGISHLYQLSESISNLRVVGSKFQFHLFLKSTFCALTVKNMIRRHRRRRLIWFCTVCRCPIKRMLDLNGLKVLYF